MPLRVVLVLAVSMGLPGLGIGRGLASAQPASTAAALQAPNDTVAMLAARARAQGTVRVIVRLRTPFVPEGYLDSPRVVLQRGDIASRQAAVLARLIGWRARLVRQYRTIPLLALELDADALARLALSPDVLSIHEDKLSRPTLAESAARIGATNAWDAGATGNGWTIAVLDTGVDAQHGFLAGKVVSEACYSTTDGGRSSSVCPGGAPESTAPGSGAPCGFEGCDHGTHVAGIAVGEGSSFSGIAHDATLISIQVFSQFHTFFDCPPGSGGPPCALTYDSDQLNGLERVYELRGAHAIAAVNMSLGGGRYDAPCDNDPLKPIVDQLDSVGILTVIAAGNDGFNDALGAPACIPGAVSVGSTTDTAPERVSTFSNSAPFLRLLAPGQTITSSVPGGGFANFNGTSMAAPHVSGALAVLRSAQPAATVDDLLIALQQTGVPVTKGAVTKPRIQVDAALSALSSCGLWLTPAAETFGPAGGTGSLQLTTFSGCAWTVTSDSPWLSITSAASGSGSATIAYTVDPNPGDVARVGKLAAGGDVSTVTQSGASCLTGLSPTSVGFEANGGNGTITVTAPDSCGWTVNEPVDVPWLVVTSAGTGAGNGTVTYSVEPNPSETARSATLVIGGIVVQISQTAAPRLTVNAASSFSATSPFITITGSASDDTGIAAVTWKTNHGASGVAVGTTFWVAQNIPLVAGLNRITIEVVDTDPPARVSTVPGSPSANTVQAVLNVTVDRFEYHLSEGAIGSFFDLDLSLANPNAVTAPVTVTFLKEDGTAVAIDRDVPALSRLTLRVDDLEELSGQLGTSIPVSTVVTSRAILPLVVERTMSWDASGYGGHTETATGPATKWYFAEGAQGFFDTYVLLANPHPFDIGAQVEFLTEFDGVVTVQRILPATSRMNVFAGEVRQLVGKAFGIVVTFSSPAIAERAMYFGGNRFWDGGHESAGVPVPSTTWFLAEGATGPYFDTYVLLANPNTTPANVTLTFLRPGGAPIVRNKNLPANARLTVNVEAESDALADTAVATRIDADVPIVAERAMYWPGGAADWQEAHNSFGVIETGLRWGLAEGRVGGPQAYDTFVLLANPTSTAADVRVIFLQEVGAAIVREYKVPPNSRFNVWVNAEAPALLGSRFSAVIESLDGVPIAVERAMYWNADGQEWAAGTNATATRLP